MSFGSDNRLWYQQGDDLMAPQLVAVDSGEDAAALEAAFQQLKLRRARAGHDSRAVEVEGGRFGHKQYALRYQPDCRSLILEQQAPHQAGPMWTRFVLRPSRWYRQDDHTYELLVPIDDLPSTIALEHVRVMSGMEGDQAAVRLTLGFYAARLMRLDYYYLSRHPRGSFHQFRYTGGPKAGDMLWRPQEQRVEGKYAPESRRLMVPLDLDELWCTPGLSATSKALKVFRDNR